MSNSTYAILPTPEHQQLPTRGAYAAYATLQNTQHQPTQHIMQFPFQLKGIVSKKTMLTWRTQQISAKEPTNA
jgi:hypothetical protein